MDIYIRKPGGVVRVGVMLRHLLDKGGITVYTRNLLDHLLPLAAGIQFMFLVEDATATRAYRGYPNVQTVELRTRNKLLWDQWAVPRAARQLGLDLIFNPKLSVPLRAPCKTVLTMHGLEQFAARPCFKKLDRLYFESAMPIFCQRADAIICMSETGRRDIQKYLGARPEKIHVIPESCNELCRVVTEPDLLARVKSRYNLPDRFILFVGGITPLKNIPTLLKAYAELKRQGFPQKLVMVGFKRWKFDAELAWIDTLGLREDVVEAGFIDDDEIPACYTLADCLVMPSFYEGFGMPILEAQACGCPVVISTGGAMPEVAGPKGALTFEPNDVGALAECLRRAIADLGLRAELREAGLKNAWRYRWATTAKTTLEMFRGLVNGKSPDLPAKPHLLASSDHHPPLAA